MTGPGRSCALIDDSRSSERFVSADIMMLTGRLRPVHSIQKLAVGIRAPGSGNHRLAYRRRCQESEPRTDQADRRLIPDVWQELLLLEM